MTNRDAPPRLCLFGIPRIEIGTVRLDQFPTKRCVHLLARLAMAHQRQMSRAHLADVLWPDSFFEEARPRLRQELVRLRRTLGDLERVLVTSADSIRLDLSNLELDVELFERQVRAARQSEDPVQRQALLAQAVEIAGSPFIADAAEDWILIERIRLNVARYGALVELGNLLLEEGKPNEALIFARDAMEIVPEREGAYLLAIQSLRELGHLEDALAQYRRLQRNVAADGGKISANAERVAEGLAPGQIGGRQTTRAELNLVIRFSVPAPSEPIIGREAPLSGISEQLRPDNADVRLVSVLGMGGIGKTHLLLYACRDLALTFNYRVAYVDLSNLADANLVPTTVLGALGLGYVPAGNPVNRLKAILSASPTVLALDNLEQFGGAVAPLLRRLLDEIPTLRILAASRTPLNLAGEYRLNLDPLELPEESAAGEDAKNSPALRLFLNVLDADRMGRTPWRQELPTLSNIVRRVQGVPLGLQLAASRLRTLGPAALLQELDEGLNRMVNRRQDAPERHRSMGNAVAGSFDQLEPPLKEALAQLSIFRGGWTLESAELVCGITNAAETMERLTETSLISVVSDGSRWRFRMLETIREHARDLLGPLGLAELRDRFLKWMVGRSRLVAFDLVDTAGKEELDRLEPEIDNLREALRYALDEAPEAAFELGANCASFWRFRTSGYEAYRFYSELYLRYPDFPPSPHMLRSCYGQSLIAQYIQDPDRAVIHDRTIRIGREVGDLSYEIKILVFQAFTAQDEIRYADCLAYFAEMDRFIMIHGDFESGAFVDRVKADFIRHQGDPEGAVHYLRNAVAWFSDRGELFYRARVRIELAYAAIDLEDFDLAEAMVTGLLEQAYEIGFISLVPMIYACSGLVALGRRRFADGVKMCQLSLRGYPEFGGTFPVGDQWNVIGRIYLEESRFADAREAFGKAAEIWLSNGRPVAAAVALFGLATVRLREGEPERAARLFVVADRECKLAGAKLIRFHTRFAERLEAELRAIPGIFLADEQPMGIDAAIRMGTLPA